MVPASFHWPGHLPLTPNGKTDRNALRALATTDAGASAGKDPWPPGTPTERRLAAAWSTALGIPQGAIGGHDHFFDLGGTSLSAVKVAILLDRAISPKDLTRCPVLADLAGLVDGRRPGTDAQGVPRPTEHPARA